jgi:hypothetical protein
MKTDTCYRVGSGHTEACGRITERERWHNVCQNVAGNLFDSFNPIRRYHLNGG